MAEDEKPDQADLDPYIKRELERRRRVRDRMTLQQYAETQESKMHEEENSETDTSRSVRVKIGDVFSARLKTSHAITAGTLLSLISCIGILKHENALPEAFGGHAPAVALAASYTPEWKTGVDERLDDHDRQLRNVNTTLDAMYCTMLDNWRWDAIRAGDTERGRYLTLKLNELARSGKDCR